MSNEVISTFFEQEHDRLNKNINHYRDLLKSGKGAKAAKTFADFKDLVCTHMEIEEETVFPFFEYDGFSPAGLTGRLRQEHEKIRALLRNVGENLEQGTYDVATEKFDQFVSMFVSHHDFEEKMIYPATDQVISEQEKEDVFRKINKHLKQNCQCCGINLGRDGN